MNSEFKEQLKKLSLQEIFEIINTKSESKTPELIPNSRYSIGKLDAKVHEVKERVVRANNQIVYQVGEYGLYIYSGTLCFVKDYNDIEILIKEINTVIAKYQK